MFIAHSVILLHQTRMLQLVRLILWLNERVKTKKIKVKPQTNELIEAVQGQQQVDSKAR